MMLKPAYLIYAAICLALSGGLLNAQYPTNSAEPSAAIQQSRTPATKLEGFKPSAGSVVMLGYDELGSVGSPPVNVDVREARDAKGAKALGISVEVTENWYRKDQSLVDADEIPDLLKGIDTLLEVDANPTKFENLEIRCITRGELLLTAYNVSRGRTYFTIQAGRDLPVVSGRLSAKDMSKFRAMIEQAAQKISSIASGK